MSKYRKQSQDASAHNDPWAGFGDRQRAAAKKRRGRQTERSGFRLGRRNLRASHSAPYAATAAAGFLNLIGDLWQSTEAGRAAHAGRERRGPAVLAADEIRSPRS